MFSQSFVIVTRLVKFKSLEDLIFLSYVLWHPFSEARKAECLPKGMPPPKKGMYVVGNTKGGNVHRCLRPTAPAASDQTHVAEDGGVQATLWVLKLTGAWNPLEAVLKEPFLLVLYFCMRDRMNGHS